MKILMEIHALQNFAPSNLNRDDTGAPKDALFGGTRRARVSSQCLKRAVRGHFASLETAGFFSADELGLRTKRLCQKVAERLGDKRDPAEAAEKARIALSYVKLKADAKDYKTQYLLYLGHAEVARLAEIVDDKWEEIVVGAEPEDGRGDAKKGKKGGKGLQ